MTRIRRIQRAQAVLRDLRAEVALAGPILRTAPLSDGLWPAVDRFLLRLVAAKRELRSAYECRKTRTNKLCTRKA